MSATGRNPGVRIDQDAYFTPHPFTYAIAPALFGYGSKFRRLPVVDPACGEGALFAPLLRLGFDPAQLYGFELNHERASAAARETAARIVVCDTLAHLANWRPSCPITILANPPYSLAFDFWKWAVHTVEACDGQAAFFLRLNFLASEERRAFFDLAPPSVGVASRRPSFVKFRRHMKDGTTRVTGSDATEYAWIVHRVGASSHVFFLDTSPDGLRASLNAAGFIAPPPPFLKGPPPPVIDVDEDD